MQVIGAEPHEPHDERERFPPIMRQRTALTSESRQDDYRPNRGILTFFISECKKDTKLMKLVRKGVKAYLGGSADRELQDIWHDAAKRAGRIKRTDTEQGPGYQIAIKALIPKTIIASVLRGLIEEEIKEARAFTKLPFRASWFNEVMARYGYTNTHNDHSKSRNPKKRAGQNRRLKEEMNLLQERCKKLFKLRRDYYEAARYYVDHSDDFDRQTKQAWIDFLDQLVFAMDAIIEGVDGRNTIYRYAYHIAADALGSGRRTGGNGSGHIQDAYQRAYTRLRDEMIIWARMADDMIIYGILEPGAPPDVPIFVPYDTDGAIFWGYYGAMCPRCKKYRARGIEDDNAWCVGCRRIFRPEVLAHCTACWKRFFKKRSGFDGLKCDACEIPVILHETKNGSNTDRKKTRQSGLMTDRNKIRRAWNRLDRKAAG